MMFLHDTFEGNGREGPCEKINLSTVVPVLSLFHRKAPFLYNVATFIPPGQTPLLSSKPQNPTASLTFLQ